MKYKVGQILEVTRSWHGEKKIVEHHLLLKKKEFNFFDTYVIEDEEVSIDFPVDGTFYITTKLFC